MTIQPFRQHPDLYHPANYKCGNCKLFKTSRCPNPEDLAVHNFQPGRWKNEESIACILIYQNYQPADTPVCYGTYEKNGADECKDCHLQLGCKGDTKNDPTVQS